MKKVVLAILALCVGCSEENLGVEGVEWCERTNYKPVDSRRIVAFGDAITQGYNITDCPHSYADFVAAAYGRQLVMKATDGSISTDHLEAVLATEILPTDVVIMISGYNDMLLYGSDPVQMAAYAERFERMLEHFAPAAQIIIGDGFTNLPIGYKDPAFPNGSDQSALDWANLNRQIVAASGLTNIEVVNTLNVLGHNPMYYTWDQVHPNKNGQAMISTVFIPRIEP